MEIGNGFANATFVISRTGDIDPYTVALGVQTTDPEGWDVTQMDTDSTAFANAVKPNLTSADTLTAIVWTVGTSIGALEYVSATNAVGTLLSASAQMPQNCAVLVQKRTSTPGRRGRGRLYWPGLLESEVDAVGTLTASVVTRMNTMLNSWKATITASPQLGQPVLFHSAGATPVPGPSNITSFTVSQVMATQRRRLRK
jgi:hypothetical protein